MNIDRTKLKDGWQESDAAPVWIICDPTAGPFYVQYLSALSSIGLDFFLSAKQAYEGASKLLTGDYESKARPVKYVPAALLEAAEQRVAVAIRKIEAAKAECVEPWTVAELDKLLKELNP